MPTENCRHHVVQNLVSCGVTRELLNVSVKRLLSQVIQKNGFPDSQHRSLQFS